jgi:hypothetical protein
VELLLPYRHRYRYRYLGGDHDPPLGPRLAAQQQPLFLLLAGDGVLDGTEFGENLGKEAVRVVGGSAVPPMVGVEFTLVVVELAAFSPACNATK